MRLFVALYLFIAFFVFITSPITHAMESTESAKPKTDYMLPYPGMLPDHPLYKLKVLRDKITEALIQDPKKKVEFYRLQTDKGIAATEELAKRKQMDLALKTALKAEHNFTLLTYEVKKQRWDFGKDEYEKLQKAGTKHQEVIQRIIDKAPKEQKKAFGDVFYFSKVNQKELQSTQQSSIRK